MVASITPRLADVVKYQLPEYLRTHNPSYIKFLEYYYEYLSQAGKPLDFLQNILEYRDVDFEQNLFNNIVIRQMLNLLPPSTKVDRNLLVKNLLKFFTAKGSEESFKFIMNVLFDEDADIEWQSKHVLRASDNVFYRNSSVLLETTDSFDSTSGAMLQQDAPYAAFGVVESVMSVSINGKFYKRVELADKTIRGKFVLGSNIKCLRNDINRTFFEVTNYFIPSVITSSTINLNGIFGQELDYSGMIIKQLGTDWTAEIVDLLAKSSEGSNSIYQFSLTNITGTANYNECYIIAHGMINTHFTKEDYYYGILSPQVDTIDVVNQGSMYKPSLPIKFEAGSGIGAEAKIESVGSGGIDSIFVINGGYGYSVGDPLVFSGNGIGVQHAIAHVSDIDGYGAALKPIMELDAVVIEYSGSEYMVGDKLYIPNTSIELQVATVVSGGIGSFNITSRGDFEVCPDWYMISPITKTGIGFGCQLSLSYRVKSVVITDSGTQFTSSTVVFEGGGGHNAEFYPIIVDGCVDTITITNGGSGYTQANVRIQSSNGHDAVLTAIITGGAISGFVTYNPGIKYQIGDIVNIIGDGTGAVCSIGTVLNGCVSRVVVVNGGTEYNRNTTLTFTTSNSGATPCSLRPIIIDGVIVSVDVLSRGEGYSQYDPVFGLLQENGDSFLVDTLTKLNYNSNHDDFNISCLTLPSIVSYQQGTGGVSAVELISGGSGYWDPSEIPPVEILVTGKGSGAVLKPVVTDGRIEKIYILDSGFGYDDTTTLSIVGGGGANAAAFVRVSDSKIFDVQVTNQGLGYVYGTTVQIFGGNGFGCELAVEVETGITNVEVSAGGKYYYAENIIMEDGFKLHDENHSNILTTMSTSITVTDPTGTGAVLSPVVDPISSAITRVDIINKGTGYTNPSYTLFPDYSSNPDILAGLVIKADRPIKKVNIIKSGESYDGVNVLIAGDGSGADVKVVTEMNGSISEVVVNSPGSGFTSTPNLSIIDTSGYGAIAAVHIDSPGSGYLEVPIIDVADKFSLVGAKVAGDAKMISTSNSIGRIEKISYINGGYGYDEQPLTMFPIPIVVRDNANFIIGEEIILKNKPYILVETAFCLMTEAGEYLTDDDLVKINQVEEQGSPYEFHGMVYDLDFERQIVYVVFNTIGTDFFNLVTEDNMTVTTNTGLNIVYENAARVDVNDVLYGTRSHQEATVMYLNRGAGNSQSTGIIHNSYQFLNDSGKLNNPTIKLHNNERIQDLAYVMTTGMSLNQYVKFIKKTVHPAGTAVFGDVAITIHDSSTDMQIMKPDETVRQLMSLFLSLSPQDLQDVVSCFDFSGDWIDTNKFFMDDIASSMVKVTSIDTGAYGQYVVNLMTEEGDLIVQDNFTDFSTSGKKIDFFKDETFATIENMSYNIDGSMEVAINR